MITNSTMIGRSTLVPTCILGLILAGCDAVARSIELPMPAHTTASVELDGDAPFAIVSNQGPGQADVVFDADSALATVRSVDPSTSTGQMLHATKRIRIAAGATPTTVDVEATGARGATVHRAAPSATAR